MGWDFRIGNRFSTAMISKQLGVVSKYQRLLVRLLEILVEEGILRCINEEWEIASTAEIQDSQEHCRMFIDQYPAAESELTLVRRCGTKLAEVLHGDSDPLQLLFPGGDLATVGKLYHDSPGARVMNTLIERTVLSAVEKLPYGRGIRILEIGAGTGGTTSYILPHLPPDRTEYVFTDISPLFTTKAQEKFADYPFVRYQLLDIERDVKPQSFELHQYDIVIAANVLHATQDLHQTLEHVLQLLSPGGMLVLLEGTTKQHWVDLTFGLTDGWWRFTDTDLRQSHPLLSARQWQELLTESGFQQSVTLPSESDQQEGSFPQSLIIAQGPEFKPEKNKKHPGCWLILSDSQGVGMELAALLRSYNEECILVFSGEEYRRVDEETFRVVPTRSEDFQQLLKDLSMDSDQFTLRGVVHLWSLDSTEAEALTVSDLNTASQLGCGSTLYLIQSLVKAEFSKPPSVWLVTRGAQSVETDSDVPGVAQSPLWGMGKVIALEHPELNCVRVDLDYENQARVAEILFEELWSEDSEDQVAYRQGARYVARLVRHASQSSENLEDQLTICEENSYLITGGPGALGLTVARWLVERGARHLVLTSRSGASSAESREKIKELEDAGAKVLLVQADVSQQDQVAGLLAEIEQSMPPLRGVIHAAGVVDDGLLLHQDWQQFCGVMAAKVQGAWNLHVLTRGTSLDFFVLFSSVASLMGSPRSM